MLVVLPRCSCFPGGSICAEIAEGLALGMRAPRGGLVPEAWCGPVLTLVDLGEFGSPLLTGLSPPGVVSPGPWAPSSH